MNIYSDRKLVSPSCPRLYLKPSSTDELRPLTSSLLTLRLKTIYIERDVTLRIEHTA